MEDAFELDLKERNRELQTLIDKLKKENEFLSKENQKLVDDTKNLGEELSMCEEKWKTLLK